MTKKIQMSVYTVFNHITLEAKGEKNGLGVLGVQNGVMSYAEELKIGHHLFVISVETIFLSPKLLFL